MDKKNPPEMAAVPPPCYKCMCKITFFSYKGPLRSEEKYCKKTAQNRAVSLPLPTEQVYVIAEGTVVSY